MRTVGNSIAKSFTSGDGGSRFFDTNILIYADDASAKSKQDRAIALIVEHRADNSLVTLLQVMQEYYAAATRKLGVAAEIAQRKVEILAGARVVRFTEQDAISSIRAPPSRQGFFWDAMIIPAARLEGS